MKRLIVMLLTVLWATVSAVASNAMHLLNEAPGAMSAPRRGDAAVRRDRLVRIDGPAMNLVSEGTIQSIELNLFDDVRLPGQVASIETRTSDSFTCTGRITGESGGWFVLVAENGVVAAEVFSPSRGLHQIRWVRDDLYDVAELDPTQFGGCDCGPQHEFKPAIAEDGVIAGDSAPSPCEQMIDVMVLYSPAAAAAAGSTSAIRALAYASVASANIAFANSGIAAKLRLVFTDEIKYEESNDLGIDLGRLTIPNDGFLDAVPALRNQHGADLVCLLVNSISNSCGVAYVMLDPSPAFEGLALSVVQQGCAISSLSFAHELGHNLGCQHNNGDGSSGAFPYSYGHRFVGDSGQQWRTVMSAVPGTRIAHFSNPDILFDGAPTGVAADQIGAADNAATINATAATAASFRTMIMTDCNGNGIADGCDVAEGTSPDINENGMPDECDPPGGGLPRVEGLVAADAESFDHFGGAVAMSEDRVVIGSELDDDAGNGSGSAYVFAHRGGKWQQEAKLVASDAAPFARFGHSVAMSEDGEWIAVGAYRVGLAVPDMGAVYVFRRDSKSESWAEDAKLPNPDPGQGDWFGWSVAIAGFVNSAPQLVISAPADDTTAVNAGAVYIVARDRRGTWNLTATLTSGSAGVGDFFGYAVAGDNDRVVIGSPFDDERAMDAGAVLVFSRAGAGWSLESTLTARDAAMYDNLGRAVAIDGRRIVTGASGDDDFGDRSGAAYVFGFDGGAWSQEAKLLADDAQQQDLFGMSVAVRGDRALAGAVLNRTSGSPAGTAYVFGFDGSKWAQDFKLSTSDGAAYDNFGIAATLAPLGDLAAIGAYFDDHHGWIDAGSVRVFSLPSRPAGTHEAGLHDVASLLAVLSGWGSCVPAPSNHVCAGDLNGDGTLDAADLLLVLGL